MILKFQGGWDYPREHTCWACGDTFMSATRNARWCPPCRKYYGHGHHKKQRYEIYDIIDKARP